MDKSNNSSHSTFKSKPKKSRTKVYAAKMVKPNINNQMKMVETVESIVQNPVLKNIDDVLEKIQSSKESVILGKTTTSDEGMKKGCGRSKLYETCAVNHWKPPVFECFKEEGPCHCIMFTFKVIVEMETGKASKNIETSEVTKTTVEVYGAPHKKKKMAADNAAEGALWYLKHIDFVLKNK
ncbi:putative double-stranded RNA-binding domain-containing protein [Medicago truncatula]|uniref:Putative double-stranded RNA-binding domain-containing protein n=1 Tax=Medicago truncatula TaxID=3880 RepID=A0A396JJW4_MEDTR|nr:dicer-like protein 4 [Medicago truncatula]RHN76583.1 putative double-stranded RNA-binding domain-containing protein [Medicago truncatula]